MAGEQTNVAVDGHRLTLSNLDKVLYPRTGTTKAEVLRYYTLVAPTLLPVLAGRPVTRKRWPNGVESEPFFVKNVEAGAPRWIPRETLPHSDKPVTYPLVDSSAVLVWMAQMAALELHVPQWRFADHRPGRPDRMVFDLDPGPGAELADCATVARWVREVLQQAGSDAVPVTSGSKGLHLYVALDRSRTSDEISAVAKAVAQSLEAEHPKLVTSKMAKSVRPGRVFIDWSQNNGAKTTIAPYSLRGRPAPTVAAPRTWEELEDPGLAHLDIAEVLQRLESGLDPWAEMFGGDPPDGPGAAGSGWSGEADSDDAGADPGAPGAAGSTGSTGSIGAAGVRGVSGAAGGAVGGATGGAARGAAGGTVAGASKSQELDADTRASAAAYAVAAMGGGEKTHGQHRWSDPLEGPRGRVVRREFARQRTGSTSGTSTGGDERPAAFRTALDLRPMLATAGDELDLGDQGMWRFEGKWDGIRALVEVTDGQVRLVGRSGRDLTAGYPELAEIADAVGDHAVVLDGEIVTLDADGRTSFPLLQQRMNLSQASLIARAREQVPVRYFAFDLLRVDGTSLLDKSYDIRRRLLAALDPVGEHIEVPAPLDGDLQQALRFTSQQQWEGLVAKRGDSTYRPGLRSGNWLKIKNQRMQEVVIIGWRPGQGRRSGSIGSLLMAVPDDGGLLRYAGRVGTGFTDKMLTDLAGRLEPADRSAADDVPAADARDARWAAPVLVGEVTFGEWTPDGRMRAPSWRGLRPDKSPPDVRRES